MEKEEPEVRILTRRITRRQAVKAGGIAALGLAFSKPIISSLQPPPAFAQVLSPGPTPTQSCTAVITSVDIKGATAADSPTTSFGSGGGSATYTADVDSSCGDCNVGNCDLDTTYLWEVASEDGGDSSITTPNASSTLVTFTADIGFFTLKLTVNITCGDGACEDTAGPLSDTLAVSVQD